MLERRAAVAGEMRTLNDGHPDGALPAESQDRWDALRSEMTGLDQRIERQSLLDDAERRMAGTPMGGAGDDRLDREIARVGILDVIRASMGGTDTAAGRAREISAELERRSGRRAQGLFWSMGAPEQRVFTTGNPSGGPGGNIIPTDYRPDQFIDRLRNATVVRARGATVLTGLSGNVSIPRRKASATGAWVAENAALTASDPQFTQVTMTPKHAGSLTEYSRNLIQQSSPDVEQLCRNDMAKVLAETLDLAAIAGTGSSNQPTGILSTSGIGAVAMGTNGAALTYDVVADLIGQVADDNAEGGSLAFVTNTKVRRAASKLKDSQDRPFGLNVVFQGVPVAYTNLVTSAGTKGSGTGLSTLLYGNWSDLLIGVWSELDILVNPFESTAYSKGNVQIRAMMTVDIAVRHPESFAAITDIVA
jgi:HK97 family phage major capsid protein